MKYYFGLIILLGLPLILGCSNTPPVVAGSPSADPKAEGMYAVSGSVFDRFFVKSAGAAKPYTAIQFAPLQLDNMQVDTRKLSFDDREWQLTEADRQSMQRIFSEQVEKVFAKSKGLGLADAPAQGVLNAEIELVEFVPSAPKDDLQSRAPTTRIWTDIVGVLEMRAKISDAQSGELVALVEDRRDVGDQSGLLERNNRVANLREHRITFTRWLKALDSEIASLR